MAKQSVNLLPTYYQTDKNKKFLSSTIDQLIQTPTIDRLNAFVGSKLSPNYNPKKDVYVTDPEPLRQNTQLLPALVIRNTDGTVDRAFGYDDLINQLNFYGSDTSNLDKLFRPDFYSYDPKIDWDKFVNYNQYYWLPTGPVPVVITGPQREVISTYKVTDSTDGNYFVFTPDGLTPDPVVTLYRGSTYIFNIDSKFPLYIKTGREPGPGDLYNVDIKNNGIENGQIVVTVTDDTPNILYYNTVQGQIAGGQFVIKKPLENSSIDINVEILGKQNYTSASGIKFINGLLVVFGGDVLPTSYINKTFVVEGVGTSITLTDFSLLKTPEDIADQYDDAYDGEPFDDYPFDDFQNVPLTPEYITINRASKDLNSWSRYNRWFHVNVIQTSATANNLDFVLPANGVAQRPIIEFLPNIQLFNYGSIGIGPVDHIDNTTLDAFSAVENSQGYWVDGVLLEEGDRVIFNADTDPDVRGRVYEVHFVTVTFNPSSPYATGTQIISLVDIEGTIPADGSSVVVIKGTNYAGTSWHLTTDKNYNTWIESQQHTAINQAPLFDVVDSDGNSFGGSAYTGNFKGTKIFGYKIGTGTPDTVLGFPLSYQSEQLESTYLFSNFFMTDTFINVVSNISNKIPVSSGYLLRNNPNNIEYINVWTQAAEYKLAVQQFQVVYDTTSSIPITVFDKPGYISDLEIKIFVNNVKYQNSQFTVTTSSTGSAVINLLTPLTTSTSGNSVLINLYTDTTPNSVGLYEVPLNLTNNPLNSPISTFTLSEVVDHVQGMVNRDPDFIGSFPGNSNLGNLPNVSQYGTRFIENKNSLSFAQYFIGDSEHSLLTAIRSAGDDYNKFKLVFINALASVPENYLPADAVDYILTTINENKNTNFPYLLSDMVPYGTDKKIRKYTVTDSRNTTYPITSVFNLSSLSNQAVLVYLNNQQLAYGDDYTFDPVDPIVDITIPLQAGDVLTINEYLNTDGCYIAPTPTKLGLYPSFKPQIYSDDTYAYSTHNVIQGHDGSITLAFNDYRDSILLEYERRIFNNLKTQYNPGLFDINSVLPGRFRPDLYSYDDTYSFIDNMFIKWSSTYGVNYESNTTYDINNHRTYNYKSAVDYLFGGNFTGSWRSIFKYYFDTDRPNITPWEMLGFTIKPSWWETQYGPAPYTSGNLVLWKDLENGYIAQGTNSGVNPLYQRPGLSKVIPVDSYGNLVDPREWGSLLLNDNIPTPGQNWSFGEWSPAETAWRKSSNWPFVVQLLMALSKPADYSNKLFDVSRTMLNKAGQYTYSTANEFISPSEMLLQGDTDSNGNIIRAAGYGVYVLEIGKKRRNDYISYLKQQLSDGDFNLFYKVGGFVSQQKLNIIVDSYNLATQNPEPYLPNENYTVFFNTSNPVLSIGLSGVIIIKSNGKYIIRGYDNQNLFFNIFEPIHSLSDPTFTVGGTSEPFSTWTAGQTYQAGQIVSYQNNYYRVVSGNISNSFNANFFQLLTILPSTGGVSVAAARTYTTTPVTVPYGTILNTVQDVFDFLIGYGKYLESLGFSFNEFNSDFGQVVNWQFSAQEFLYWSAQKWADGSVITLSPFADVINFNFQEGVVDNVLDSFYDYSIYAADGSPIPINSISITRSSGTIKINSNISSLGIFFIRFNLVQKEHALIFDNTTVFGDVIYDEPSGYRQLRMKIQGFKTSTWNGDFFAPGFVYDGVTIKQWAPYQSYMPSEVVQYVGNFYSAIDKITGTQTFDFKQWYALPEKPTAQLLPNFDYKINQFLDFYSLDIDNFDSSQQAMAQHLTGYSPRPYLDNILTDSIAEYKFYQGYIKEKGTLNSIIKLEKAAAANMLGTIDIYEEWAFRLGAYGSYSTYNELEFPLNESSFLENNQGIQFVNQPTQYPLPSLIYITPSQLDITPNGYISTQTFATTTSTDILSMPYAGYPRLDDVQYTFTTTQALLSIDNTNLVDGDKIWIGFEDFDGWNVYRYTRATSFVTSATSNGTTITFNTKAPHGLQSGEYVSVTEFSPGVNAFYNVATVPTITSFVVNSKNTVPTGVRSEGVIFHLTSARFQNVDNIGSLPFATSINPGELFWVDDVGTGRWGIYKKSDIYSDSIQPSYIGINGEQFGHTMAKRATSSTIVVSATGYTNGTSDGPGRVFVYDIDPYTGKWLEIVNYRLNLTGASGVYPFGTGGNWRPSGDTAPFGDVIFYDDVDDVIFAAASNATTSTQTLSNQTQIFASTSSGIVKISGVYRGLVKNQINEEITFKALYNPGTYTNYSRFGSSIFVQASATNKLLFVGAPGVTGSNFHHGEVYMFDITVTSNPTYNNYVGTSTSFYSNVSGVTTNLGGALATFNVRTVTGQPYLVTTGSNTGTSYSVGSQILISGNNFGGSTANNLLVTVTGINGFGNITSFTSSGTPYLGTSATFNISTLGNSYIVTQGTSSGTNYTNNSTIVIGGDQLGGLYPDNDLIISVTAVNTAGSIVSFSNSTSIATYKAFTIVSTGTLPRPIGITTSSEFGYKITGNRSASILAVSAPGINTGTGAVYIYTGTGGIYTFVQAIDPTTAAVNGNYKNSISIANRFGSEILINDEGTHLFVAAPNARDKVTYPGKVGVYSWNGNQFVFQQLIDNPAISNVNFGQSLSVTPSADSLLVTGQGNPFFLDMIFDNGKTTFDNQSCKFGDTIKQSGSAYVYERYNKDFIFVQQLIDNSVDTGGNYGFSSLIDQSTAYVSNPDIYSGSTGTIHIWNKINTATSYSSFRSQTDLVNINLIDKSFTIDTLKQQLVDYLDIVDPIKGKIAGLAEEDLKYKTPYDPAFYSYIADSTLPNVNDPVNAWQEDHVGEVWWDLSTVKYIWYEQGETVYRKNAWGTTFPGSNIDVYEWVESTYRPSQWNALSSNNQGLTLGITGTPKFPNDSAYSSRQVYDSSTGQFTTLYYYWVKNKSNIPGSVGRRIPVSDIATIIANPVTYGERFIAITGPDSVSVNNYKNKLIGDRINLNIGYDTEKTPINKHTDWVLIQENNSESLPTSALTQKLFDSLIGTDVLGNPVPDPTLSMRQAYGIQIRPRQSMFVDRVEALRNLMGFTNKVLSKILVNESLYNFDLLNSKEEIPNILLGEYDQVVEDKIYLDSIITENFVTAQLTCSVTNGRISNVYIEYAGYGYLTAPTVTIGDGSSSAILKTTIDDNGSINYVEIIDRGQGFITAPILTVRPYTVILNIDPEYNNKWSKFAWSGNSWTRIHTQSYNTTQYWKYIDWQSSDFNSLKSISYAVDYVYETQQLTLITGDYVKVQNGGNGNYIILRRTAEGVLGTFDSNFDIVYSQNGTIQILDIVWNSINSSYNFDETSPYDQTLFDQTPTIELTNILKAIKDDLFSGDNSLYWNQFFFAAVKYALTEQPFLDWAFKTSFINVINQAGVLDQRTNYRFQDPTWYNDYINEIKPYHTQIRNYQVNYNIGKSNDTPWDPTYTYSSDFDLPSFFDTSVNTFTVVTTSSSLLSQYPYKAWYDNFRYSISEIILERPGSGYTVVPEILIVPAPEDSGSGATAEAYVSNGTVSFIKLTNPGSGYTITPTVLVIGGGNTAASTATAYAQLSNGLVRNNFVRMKFDRISTATTVGSTYATTTATANGSNHVFPLTWAASPIKTDTTVYLDGRLVLKSQYTITNFTSIFKGFGTSYEKQSSEIILNFVPQVNQVLTVNYKKNIELYSAADRIRDYYNPAPGMLGRQLAQLMYGTEYPATTVEGTGFDAGFGAVNFGTGNFDDSPIDIFSLQVTTSTNSQTFITAEVSVNFIVSNPNDVDPSVYPVNTNPNAYGVSYNPAVNEITYYQTTSTAKIVSSGTAINVYLESWGQLNPILNTGTNVLLSSIRLDGTGTNAIFPTPIGTGTAVSVTIPKSAFSLASSFSRVVFRTEDQNASLLSVDIDTVIDGGNLPNITTAIGYRPSDIIIDGSSSLVSSITSYGPEEMIPGQVQDNLGIDVFTRSGEGSPVIVSQIAVISNTETNVSTVIDLNLTPPSTSSVIVSYNSKYLTYGIDYTLNIQESTLTLLPQTQTGILSIAVVGVGGIELLSSVSLTTSTSNISINARNPYFNIGSVYITVNGETAVNNTTTGIYYTLSESSTGQGIANVYGMTTGTTNLVQGWFFAPNYKAYSEVKQQIIQVTTTTSTFKLLQVPGFLGPFEEQAIVEVNGLRVTPPDTTYYQVSNNQLSFSIHPNIPAAPGIYSLDQIRIFRNGVEINKSTDFLLLQSSNSVLFNPGFLINGDVLAIETYNNAGYSIDEKIGTITLADPVNDQDIVSIVTFTNGDASGMRTEQFIATESNLYVMQRPILNDNYVWVTINGKPLIRDLDYTILNDRVTVQINVNYQYNTGDTVLVTSINDVVANNAIGFKIIKDILGRTQFKRFSEQNTTVLAQDLHINDTQIYVENSSVLSLPIPGQNKPGIVFINSERIEYLTITGNILSNIRRGTLGTGAKNIHLAGSTVVDMAIRQTIPTTYRTKIQNIITTSTNTYYISPISTSSNFYNGDGITIIPSTTSTNGLSDQVDVYYTGIKLNKTTTTYHYNELGYDSGDNSSDVIIPPEFVVNYDAINKISTITLNLGPLSRAQLVTGGRLTLMQNTDQSWYTVGEQLSLLNEITPQAVFLLAEQSGLPDKYQYEST